jgi:hypothetical protein
VDNALRLMIDQNMDITEEHVKKIIFSGISIPETTDIHILPVDLACYDELLREVASC